MPLRWSFLLPFLLAGTLRAQYRADARTELAGGLEALNVHFHGLVQFTIDKNERLIADLFDATGRFRQDVVYLEFLDPATFAYVPEEQVVMLKCTADRARCVDKELFKLGTISHTGRMNLPLPTQDPDGRQALALLGKLVRDQQRAQHERGAATDRRSLRKN